MPKRFEADWFGNDAVSQDYDEGVVSISYGDMYANSSATPYKWMDALQPYVKSEQIFNCPSDSTSKKYQFHNKAGLSGDEFGSYAINGIGSAFGNGSGSRFAPSSYLRPSWPPRKAKLSSWTRNSETVWVGDNSTNAPYRWMFFTDSYNDGMAVSSGNPPVLQTGANSSAFSARHLETVSLLYCDGHVKATKLDGLTTYVAANGYKSFAADSP